MARQILSCFLLAAAMLLFGCSTDSSDSQRDVSISSIDALAIQVRFYDEDNAEITEAVPLNWELKSVKGGMAKLVFTKQKGEAISFVNLVVGYDGDQVRPEKVERGVALDDSVNFFNTFNKKGLVPLVIARDGLQPLAESGVYAEMWFARGNWDQLRLTQSALSLSMERIADLRTIYNSENDSVELRWTERNTADYTGDGVVAGNDVLQIFEHMGEDYDADDRNVCRDGDGSGFIDTPDGLLVGVHYQHEIEGYDIFRSNSYSNLGPDGWLETIERIDEFPGCQPEYSGLIYDAPYNPFFYTVRPWMIDDTTGLKEEALNSNWATGALCMFMTQESNYYAPTEEVVVQLAAGMIDRIRGLQCEVRFDPEVLSFERFDFVPSLFDEDVMVDTQLINDGLLRVVLFDDESINPWLQGGYYGNIIFNPVTDAGSTNIQHRVVPDGGSYFWTDDAIRLPSSLGDTWVTIGDADPPAPPLPLAHEFFDDGSAYGNFTAEDNPNNPNDSVWHRSNLSSFSPNHAWWCGDPDTGTYDDNDLDDLTTREIDLSAIEIGDPITLEFKTKYSFQSFPGTDYGRIEIFRNGNGPILLETLEGESDPDGPENEWTTLMYDLGEYAGDRIQIRFRFISDGLNHDFGGWWLDDVAVHSVPDAFVNPCSVAIIDGSGMGYPALDTDQGEFQEAVRALGYQVGSQPEADHYTRFLMSEDSPTYDEIKDYDVVMFFVSQQYDTPVSFPLPVRSALEQFMAAGGPVFINSGAMTWGIIDEEDDTTWFPTWFAVTSYIPDGNGAWGDSPVNGVTGTLGENLIDLQREYSYATDVLLPLGSTVFCTTDTFWAGSGLPIGVQTDLPSHRAVLLSLALDRLLEEEVRSEILHRSINWFGHTIPGEAIEFEGSDILPEPPDGEGFSWRDERPLPPTQFSAECDNQLVRLYWQPNARQEYCELWRSAEEYGEYQLYAARVHGDHYLDYEVLNGSTYYYRLVTVDLDGHRSFPTAPIESTPGERLRPPRSVSAEGTLLWNNLEWSAVAGAEGYRIYKAESAEGPFTLMAGAPPESLSMIDFDVTQGEDYFYYITTVCPENPCADESSESAVVSATPG